MVDRAESRAGDQAGEGDQSGVQEGMGPVCGMPTKKLASTALGCTTSAFTPFRLCLYWLHTALDRADKN